MCVGAHTGELAGELPLTRDAIAFARERHRGQRRASDGAPFLIHPLEVASILTQTLYPDHVIAAGVLHDVIEDTDVQRSALEERFGREVADLVALVSDDPILPDEEARKTEVRERVRRAGGHALAIFAADKISKVRELRTLVADGVLDADAEAKLRRYEAGLAMLEEQAADPRLVALLREELAAPRALAPAPAPAPEA